MQRVNLKPETLALTDAITNHRLQRHDLFDAWARRPPRVATAAALFHQIQKFCASTRPVSALPDGLRAFGLTRQAELIDEIGTSESGHGKDLAEMAAYVVRHSPDGGRLPDVTESDSQQRIEAVLKDYSDRIFGDVPGYSDGDGLTPEAVNAIAVFERRARADYDTVIYNLGVALALEITSNRYLIPGEEHAFVSGGAYGLSLDDGPMHYLREHYGECGAEQGHENNVIEAVDDSMTPATAPLLRRGANDFLDSVVALWDRLAVVMVPHDVLVSEPA